MTPLFQNITNELYQHLTAKPINFSSSTGLYETIKSNKSDIDPRKIVFIDMAVKLGLNKDLVIFLLQSFHLTKIKPTVYID